MAMAPALAGLRVVVYASLSVAALPSPRKAHTDEGIELVVTSVRSPTPRTCYEAKGIPDWINGTYLISGPALFELGGYKYQSIMDGLGMTNRFEFQAGQVCYTSAWMQTGQYQEAMQKLVPPPGLQFEECVPERPGCPVYNPMCNAMGANDNNWVNSIQVGREVLLLSDTQLMLRVDLDTLNVTGIKRWADDKRSTVGPPQPTFIQGLHVGMMGSAHPMKIPGTETFVEFTDEMPEVVGKAYLDVYTFDASVAGLQNRTLVGRIATEEGNRYLHSFGVTPNYVVLPFNMKMNINPLGASTMLGNFIGDWKGIYVMDWHGRARLFDTAPFFHLHTVNAFENGTGIVLDLGHYDHVPFVKSPALDIGMFLNRTVRNAGARAGVRRLHLHLAGPRSGSVTFEELWPRRGRQVDFFNVNPAFRGRPYCIYYATEWFHDDAHFGSMAIYKHDICTGVVRYWSRPDVYVGEPFFVADWRAGAEDAGVVVFLALDGRDRRSNLVTLNATSMQEIEAIRLPGHIPFTAHGNYFPAGAHSPRDQANDDQVQYI